MTAKKIREIQFEKGAAFTTKFILKFERDWNEVTQKYKNAGSSMVISTAKNKK